MSVLDPKAHPEVRKRGHCVEIDRTLSRRRDATLWARGSLIGAEQRRRTLAQIDPSEPAERGQDFTPQLAARIIA